MPRAMTAHPSAVRPKITFDRAGLALLRRGFGVLLRRWWRGLWPVLAMVALGGVAACGFQPLGWWPLALLGVGGLAVLVAGAQTPGRAALRGWLFGLGHFALGLNWIATAFTYQAKMPPALGMVAVVGLSAWLAVWPAAAAAGAWAFRRSSGARVLGFAGCWIVAEWMRGWVLTGFAWNPLGAVLLGDFVHPGAAALAPWLGSYGLSGLAAGLAAVVGEGLLRLRTDGRRAAGLVAVPIVLVGLALHAPKPSERPGHVAYTLIQPNVTQAELADPAHFDAQFAESARLSAPHNAAPRLVLWPESGVPDYLRDSYPWWYYEYTFGGDPLLARLRLGRAIGDSGVLLTGSVDLDFAGKQAVGGQNVITGVDGHGRVVASYAKAHLVPFGEYLPWRWLLKPLGLERVIPGDMDFRPGPGPRTVDLGALGKAGLQICYEIVFPGETVDRAHRPDYIVNPSNDGWYGAWGPPQHLAQARLRAAEEGLPVLRSTTNGISAVVDASGVVRAFVPRGVAGRLDGVIPAAAAPGWFARAGNMLPLGIALGLLAGSALVLRRRRG